jgi:phosphonate degradation associated HDIG domain protein
MISVEEIVSLYERKGAAWYGGEPVSQLDHALQCAAHAEREGASAELVAASFLHDIGHLLAPHTEIHQYLALPFLRPSFGDAVLEPIRLHVDAKRYLCFAEKGYWDDLSDASKHSLEVQGGAFDAKHAHDFLKRPFARDAVKLRLWDDLSKVPGAPGPTLADMAKLLGTVTHCHKTATAGA